MGEGSSFLAENGKATEITIEVKRAVEIQAKFYECIELSSTSRFFHIDRLLDQILTFAREPHEFIERQIKTIPVKDKWIYIFKKYSNADNGCSLDYELKVIGKNGKQKYRLVDWSEKKRSEWQEGKYPRDLGNTSYDKFDNSIGRLFSFDENFETYVLLSQIPLPLHRIEFYRKHPDVLAKRALHIPKEVGSWPKMDVISSDETRVVYQVPVFLVDFIENARAFQQEFIDMARAYNEYVTDKVQVKKRYLADRVWGLCEEYWRIHKDRSMRRWIRYEELEKFLEDEDRKLKNKHEEFDNACGRKSSWMSTEGFKATADDYDGDEEIEKNIQLQQAWLLVGNITCRKGLEYLDNVLGDKESWFHKYFFADEPFTCWKKSIAAVNEAFSAILMPFMVARVKHVAHAATEEVSSILTRRNLIVQPKLVQKNGKYFWVAEADEYTPFKITKYELERAAGEIEHVDKITRATAEDPKKALEIMERRQATFEKIDNVTGIILIPMEFLNLANELKSLVDQYNKTGFSIQTVKVVGAAADSLSALKVLLEKYIDEVSELATSEITKKALAAAFPAVNMVGSLCDYAVGVSETYNNIYEGKVGLGLAHATTALAATAALAGSALAFGEAIGATGWTFLGVEVFGTTVWGLSATLLGVIGVAIMLVGVILIYILTETPLETWAKECAWGRDPDVDLVDITERELDSQIRKLHELLCEFDVKCGYYVEQRPVLAYDHTFDYKEVGVALRIRVGMFDRNVSKFVVTNLHIRNRKGAYSEQELVEIISEEKLELSASSCNKCQVESWSGAVRRIDLVWTFDELRALGVPVGDLKKGGEFECSVQLDLRGDGSDMYPVPAKQCHGNLRKIVVQV